MAASTLLVSAAPVPGDPAPPADWIGSGWPHTINGGSEIVWYGYKPTSKEITSWYTTLMDVSRTITEAGVVESQRVPGGRRVPMTGTVAGSVVEPYTTVNVAANA